MANTWLTADADFNPQAFGAIWINIMPPLPLDPSNRSLQFSQADFYEGS